MKYALIVIKNICRVSLNIGKAGRGTGTGKVLHRIQSLHYSNKKNLPPADFR